MDVDVCGGWSMLDLASGCVGVPTGLDVLRRLGDLDLEDLERRRRDLDLDLRRVCSRMSAVMLLLDSMTCSTRSLTSWCCCERSRACISDCIRYECKVLPISVAKASTGDRHDWTAPPPPHAL